LTDSSAHFRRRSRRVLAGGFAGSLFSVGLTIYLFGVFQDALVEAFSTDVATLSLAPALFTAISGLLSPVVGRSLATQRQAGLSIRWAMIAGALAIGTGLVFVSRSGSLPAATAAYALLVVPGAILLGPLVGQTLITNWFDASRGRALGIVSAGTTCGGVVLPPIAATWIEWLGWRDAMLALGALVIVVAIPIVGFCVRDTPSEVGEHPDGRPPSSAVDSEAGSASLTDAPSSSGLLRDPRLWLSGIAFGGISVAGLISTVFTVPYATELGIPLVGGSLIVAMRAGSAALGKIVLGSVSDRFGPRPVLLAIVVLEIVLTLFLVQTHEPWLFAALGVAIGFVGGAPLPLKAAWIGQLFGRERFAAALGLLSPIGLPLTLFMVPLAGWLYQRVGTYAAAFGLAIPCFAVGGICLALVRLQASRSSRSAG
jgi:sugar phosphate permease